MALELQCGNSQPELLKVDWLPPERYASFRGRLHDGAALAVCYQPLGTQKQVSSIVIAGYTGLSSMLAAEEAAYKLPEFDPEFDPEKTPGDPWYTVMRCSYH